MWNSERGFRIKTIFQKGEIMTTILLVDDEGPVNDLKLLCLLLVSNVQHTDVTVLNKQLALCDEILKQELLFVESHFRENVRSKEHIRLFGKPTSVCKIKQNTKACGSKWITGPRR